MDGLLWAGLWSAVAASSSGILTPIERSLQDDDWEYAADAARNISVATARYGDGAAVIVQCAPMGLRVVVAGLPATPARVRVLAATRADGRSDTQTWFGEPGATAFTATVSGRDARFLRGGGAFQLRSPAGSLAPIRAEFDLPTQNANLDRVLTACGYAFTDERDLLPRASDDLKSQWEVDHAEDTPREPSSRRRSRSVSGGEGRGRNDAPPTAPPPPEPADLSCLVRNGGLSDCRFDHAQSRSTRDDERRLRFLNDMKLEQVGAAANEGRVYYPGSDGEPRIITVIDYIR